MFARLPVPSILRPHVTRGSGRRRQSATEWPLRGPSGVFAKGLRDARRPSLLVGLGFGLLVAFYGMSIATNYATAASREEAVAALLAVPAVGALAGEALNATTLGGFLSWRLFNLMPLAFGAWSILALSGTLAGEARAGMLELVATAPVSRRRIALEKAAAHVASLTIAVALLALLTWVTAVVCARLPGDAVSLVDALAAAAVVALLGLVAGALAFALAPLVGRGPAAGLAGIALASAYLVTSYSSVVDAVRAVSGLSWFTWTAAERPLAGSHEPGSLIAVVGVVVGLLGMGTIAFERRDLGAVVHLPTLAMPDRRLLLRGPARAAFLVTRSAALAWGVAVGVYAFLVGVSAPGFVAQFSANAEATRLMDQFFPGLDWRTTGGMLHFLFFSLGMPLMALAGAALVNALASEEQERRLDLLLTTPVSRARWFASSGLGTYASLASMTLVVALAAAAGALVNGDDAVQPFIGTCVAGLYMLATTGIGLAVFGVGLPRLAGAVTACIGVGLVVFDLVGAALRVSPEILALSLSRHLGQPMIGVYDGPGMLLAIGLAVGGLLMGAYGLARRDVGS